MTEILCPQTRAHGRPATHRWAALLFAVIVQSFAPARADLAGLDPPFRVNEIFGNSQFAPAVAMNAAGASVVVWRSFAGEPEIRAQRFDSVGRRVGSEFPVNTTTAGVQDRPDVAIDDLGNFVVVWESLDQDGSGYGVYAQRFGSDGMKRGGEFRVNVATEDKQRRPAIAIAADGRFVVVWEANGKDGSFDAIVARRFAANGTPQSGEVIVNEETQGIQAIPDVAMAPNGRFVVVWETTAYPTGGGSDVAAQRFAVSGAKLGGEILVNSTTAHTQDSPRVAIGTDGRFIVVWESFGQDGSDHGIFSQRFAAGGALVGGEVQVNAFTQGIQNEPAVALLADGSALVAWRDFTRDGVFARRVGPGGGPLGGEIAVDAGVSGAAEVAADLDGDVFLVWQDTGPDVFGRFGRLDGPCRAGEFAACLNQQRFEVEVAWRDGAGNIGSGHGSLLTGDTGAFWFFDAANVELVVKVLDACAINGRRWVFAAGLTDVEVHLAVTDSATGVTKSYSNALGVPFAPIQDTLAFSCAAAARSPIEEGSDVESAELPQFVGATRETAKAQSAATGSCQKTTTNLCLNADRFRVTAGYSTNGGTNGASNPARGVTIAGDSGYLTFFDPANVEVVVKVLNGCALNDRYWVFAAGLTNVEVEIEVIDTVSGAKREYGNAQGNAFQLIRDTDAFLCP